MCHPFRQLQQPEAPHQRLQLRQSAKFPVKLQKYLIIAKAQNLKYLVDQPRQLLQHQAHRLDHYLYLALLKFHLLIFQLQLENQQMKF